MLPASPSELTKAYHWNEIAAESEQLEYALDALRQFPATIIRASVNKYSSITVAEFSIPEIAGSPSDDRSGGIFIRPITDREALRTNASRLIWDDLVKKGFRPYIQSKIINGQESGWFMNVSLSGDETLHGKMIELNFGKPFVERTVEALLALEEFVPPPSWSTTAVLDMTKLIVDLSEEVPSYKVLVDALLEAGCDNKVLLDALRSDDVLLPRQHPIFFRLARIAPIHS